MSTHNNNNSVKFPRGFDCVNNYYPPTFGIVKVLPIDCHRTHTPESEVIINAFII